MYLKFSVEGLVFDVDRLGCKVLGLDINIHVCGAIHVCMHTHVCKVDR